MIQRRKRLCHERLTELLAYCATEDRFEIWEVNPAVRERIRALLASSPFPDQGSFSTSPEVPAVRRLQEIQAPTLILVGEFDIPQCHAHAGAINLAIPNSTREIVRRAGHLVPAEQPEESNKRVLEFLAERRQKGGASVIARRTLSPDFAPRWPTRSSPDPTTTRRIPTTFTDRPGPGPPLPWPGLEPRAFSRRLRHVSDVM